MAGYITQAAAPALLAYYAGLFAAPLSSFQRALITATYVTAGAGLVGAAYVLFGSIYGFVDPFEAHYWIRLTVAASRLFPLLALIPTVAVSRGAEGGRVGWTTLSVSPLALAGVPWIFTTGCWVRRSWDIRCGYKSST